MPEASLPSFDSPDEPVSPAESPVEDAAFVKIQNLIFGFTHSNLY